MIDEEMLKVVYPQWEDEICKGEQYRQYAQDLLDCFGGIKYNRALEIGFENGVSACAILHCQPQATLTSVDVRPHTKGHEYIARRPDLNSRFRFICGMSERVWSKVEACELVYIDGDHSYEGCFRDVWNGWQRVLKPGGSLVMDDTIHPLNKSGAYGCDKAAKRIQECFKDEIVGVKMVGRLLQITKKEH